MPIYVFQCPSCERQFEVIQSYKDPSPVCGDCEAKKLPSEMQRAVAQTGGFILKGNGWYATDYKGKK